MTAHRDVVLVETPEHVVFEYELAGLGSRIVAAVLDMLLVGAILLAIILVLFIMIAGTASGDLGGEVAPWMVALGLLSAFVTLWGYPILFELLMKGQTPGKRALGMRVIREGGFALTPAVVVVRNLMRVVDFLPAGYALGVLVMMIHPRYKRVGDMVAGTIVIKDRPENVAPLTRPAARLPARLEGPVAELRQAGVHRLSAEQVRLIEEYLGRRAALSPEAARRLGLQLAQAVAATLGVPPREHSLFLEAALHAYRESERQAAGEAAPAEEGMIARLRAGGVERLQAAQVESVDDFLRRRDQLSPEEVRRKARDLAEVIAIQLGVPPGDPERFLQQVVVAYREVEGSRGDDRGERMA